MSISSRFSVAVHILTLLDYTKDQRISSEFIAGSVNTNPVVIRRIMGQLSKAGLIATSPGVAGASLTREANAITLLDVYLAVQQEQRDELFAIHDKPNPLCQVGRGIQGALETSFAKAQYAMEQELARTTIAELAAQMDQT
ncbi:DNA-binding IscR family transcriptional regulator [Paenibacillus phyllosphaerae]|uniref:DNA-binding IscR family transcriptional regulator n=1 Tax=Paenibacillus phyllosphaerae TaxID=274593 RepID=A0A7W5AU61_9BACL|nr:Rrf2 family transcriptional regulator [Paenibacillus phyllosphaerae]MBB3108346.1 DNA-binding IscR family transcriptional regulator [Paenibacillus phyllosphaerae]